MKRRSLLTAFVAYLVTPLLVASGEPPAPNKDRAAFRDPAFRIKHRGLIGEEDDTKGQLCVLGGTLMFISTFENGKAPGKSGDPSLPDISISFLREGQLLRATVRPVNVPRERNASKELLAKDGWYVTADFSTDPPQVALTVKPTKGSRWTTIAADLPGRYSYKNEDAPGEAVWLTMEKDGKTYRGGIARKPILSAEKSRFSFEEADSGK